MPSSRYSENEKLLIEQDTRILLQARVTIYKNRRLFHCGVLDLEVSELAQRTRIKLWEALEKHPIHNLAGFVRTVVYHEFVTMLRQRNAKPVVPLLVDEEGELYHSDMLPLMWEDDPADILEQKELTRMRFQAILTATLTLSKGEKRAMLLQLKEKAEDLATLRTLFLEHDIDLDALNWPALAAEIQSIRTSASLAKKKLRKSLPHECADDPYIAALAKAG